MTSHGCYLCLLLFSVILIEPSEAGCMDYFTKKGLANALSELPENIPVKIMNKPKDIVVCSLMKEKDCNKTPEETCFLRECFKYYKPTCNETEESISVPFYHFMCLTNIAKRLQDTTKPPEVCEVYKKVCGEDSATPAPPTPSPTTQTIEATPSTPLPTTPTGLPTTPTGLPTTPTIEATPSTPLPTTPTGLQTTPTGLPTTPTIEATPSTAPTIDATPSTAPTTEATPSTPLPTTPTGLPTTPTIEATPSTAPTIDATPSTAPTTEATPSTPLPTTPTGLPTTPTIKATPSTAPTIDATSSTAPTTEATPTIEVTTKNPSTASTTKTTTASTTSSTTSTTAASFLVNSHRKSCPQEGICSEKETGSDIQKILIGVLIMTNIIVPMAVYLYMRNQIQQVYVFIQTQSLFNCGLQGESSAVETTDSSLIPNLREEVRKTEIQQNTFPRDVEEGSILLTTPESSIIINSPENTII